MKSIRRLSWVGILVAVLGLAACATSTEPFEYESYNEVKPGPGVFTGEKGTWTIYRQEVPAEPEATPGSEKAQGQPEPDPDGNSLAAPGESSPE